MTPDGGGGRLDPENQGSRINDQGSDQGSRIKHKGRIKDKDQIKDQRSRIKDQGSDQGSRTMDLVQP